MAGEGKTKQICYLCGTSIEKGQLSREHVPPKAFYPKNVRAGLNLQALFAHKICNEDYRKDEEYFQHTLLIEVLNQKSPITKQLLSDLRRRSRKPQTPALMRKILKGASNVTPGGIHLPKKVLQVEVDQLRIERVVLKIVRGLFYIENGNFLPLENAKDIRFCLNKNEVPELYRLYWPHTELRSVCQEVFSYKYFKFENLHLYSLMFWEAIMFRVAFEEP